MDENSSPNSSQNDKSPLQDKKYIKSMAYGHSIAKMKPIESLKVMNGSNINIKRSTIFNWFNEFKSNDSPQFERKKGSGGKPMANREMRVKQVESLIRESRYITYNDLEFETSISRGSLERIIKDLKVKKLKGVWVPFDLTAAHKERRKEWCKSMLEQFDDGNSEEVDDIITGDETWMFFKTIYR